jgi:hypothetical protein
VAGRKRSPVVEGGPRERSRGAWEALHVSRLRLHWLEVGRPPGCCSHGLLLIWHLAPFASTGSAAFHLCACGSRSGPSPVLLGFAQPWPGLSGPALPFLPGLADELSGHFEPCAHSRPTSCISTLTSPPSHPTALSDSRYAASHCHSATPKPEDQSPTLQTRISHRSCNCRHLSSERSQVVHALSHEFTVSTLLCSRSSELRTLLSWSSTADKPRLRGSSVFKVGEKVYS